MMDLITALIVDSALDQSQTHRDIAKAHRAEHLKGQIPDIADFFKALDTDGSGFITRPEILMLPNEIAIELMAITGGNDLGEIFDYLDSDDSGFIDIEEISLALQNIIESQINIDTRRMMKAFAKNLKDVDDVKELCLAIIDKLEERSARPSGRKAGLEMGLK